MYRIIPVLLMVMLASMETFGQCTKDTDCKGNRVCVNGECVEPSSQTGGSLTTSGANVEGSQWTGWGNGAGVAGFVFSPVILGLSIGSTIARSQSDDAVPSAPLGITSQLLCDIAVPVVAAGGSSSRHTGAHGLLGLRIPGWISFGLSNAFLAIILGIAAGGGGAPPPAVLLSEGILSTTSCVLLSTDALVSKSQARDGRRAECRNIPTLHFSLGTTRNGGVKGGVAYCF